jgi:indole-3-glycerol phosphate synthase
MLASVLTSEKAIQVNIRIVRIFARMRELAVLNKDLFEKISKIENTINDHDQKILLLFEYLTQFEKAKQEEQAFKDRNPIGFRLGGDI